MKIINKTKNTLLAEEATIADALFKRLKGLLGRKRLRPGEALILKPCNSIHTFFMHFPIDVIFVDINNKMVRTISSIKPWRLTAVYFSAKYCVELPEGTISSTLTSQGDLIAFS